MKENKSLTAHCLQKNILKPEIKIVSNERAWGSYRIDPWQYNCPVHLNFFC